MFASYFKIFIALLAVINPIGMILPFLGLTQNVSKAKRKKIAMRASLLSAFILIGFTLLGDFLLNWLKISEAAFYVTGGILLFRASLNMILAQHSGIDSTTQEEESEAEEKDDVSIFPLAIPLLAGPGSIATVILLAKREENLFQQHSFIITSLLLIAVLTYTLFRLSEPLSRLLGVTGTNVIGRIFGVILAAFSVQFIFNGIAMFVTSLVDTILASHTTLQ